MRNRYLLLIACLFFSISLAFGQSPQAINYQGVARDAQGNPLVNQAISVKLSVLDGSPVGTVVYSETHTLSTNSLGLFNLAIGSGTVVSGTFAGINWGSGAKFMKVEMDPAGGTAYLNMGTSQMLSVPYALYAENAGNASQLPAGSSGETMRHDGSNWISNSNLYNNGTNIGIGTSAPTEKLDVSGKVKMTGFQLTTGGGAGKVLTSDASGNGTWQNVPAGGVTLDGAYDFGGAGAGRVVTADAGAVEINHAGAGSTGIDVNASGSNSIAIRADQTSTGVAIRAENTLASNSFAAIQAQSNSSTTSNSAINGTSTGAAYGVGGQVLSTATGQAGVYGSNLRTNGGHGVYGVGYNGLVGETNYSSGYAIYGENFDAIAPLGNGVGVAGRGYYGVFGEDRYSGTISGAYGVYSNGNFGATGTKTFRIDHPLDPANKYLIHNSIESPEVLNVYRGNAVLDANGEAVIQLPAYFGAVNQNFSYHLTPVGGFAQLYVKSKISNNQFTIAGGTAGMEVSWMVYGERNDVYLQNRPDLRNPEPDKPAREQGKYLMPQDYNQPEDQGIFYHGESGDKADQPVLKTD